MIHAVSGTTLRLTENYDFVRMIRDLANTMTFEGMWKSYFRIIKRSRPFHNHFKNYFIISVFVYRKWNSWKLLRKVYLSSCHTIIDIWTTRRNMSVLGIKAQFVDCNWTLCNRLLSFRCFDVAHNELNIRRDIMTSLKDFLLPQQVNFLNERFHFFYTTITIYDINFKDRQRNCG